jgi:hypothetical protein
MNLMDTKLDNPPGRLYRHYNSRLAEFAKDDKQEKARDKESRKLVIQDFANRDGKWEVEEFPGEYFPVDLSVTRGYPDTDGVNRFICLELKTAENDNTLAKIANGPSKGAFIPLHKIAYLGTALDFVIDYNRAGLVYIIEGERYYIPYPILCSPTWLFQSRHPLDITATSPDPDDRAKFFKEGNLAMEIRRLQYWHGLTPFLSYVETGWINKCFTEQNQ